jgi:tRNA threonylcarbamoyladenosine biosynthesis protein TsaB
MYILAADTTTSINTVAVVRDDRILAETIVDCGRSHSERLIDTVDWALAEAGLTLEQIDTLAISVGPGSFTGVRVGVAMWKGLAFGRKLPLVPVDTLDAMTHLSAFRDAVVCPLLDAKMGEIFGAVYHFRGGRREKRTEDRVCPVEALLDGLSGEVLFLGEGAVRYRERIVAKLPAAAFLPAHCAVPRAAAVACEALALLAGGVCTDAASVTPVYLRKSQAELNRERIAEGRRK